MPSHKSKIFKNSYARDTSNLNLFQSIPEKEGFMSFLTGISSGSPFEIEPVEDTTYGRNVVWVNNPSTGTFTTTVSEEILSKDLRVIRDAVESLVSRLAEQPKSYTVQINSLNSKILIVGKPISILVEETEDEVIASWPEIGSFGRGSSVFEALVGLKADIERDFLSVVSRDNRELGEIAKYNKLTMSSYITKTE